MLRTPAESEHLNRMSEYQNVFLVHSAKYRRKLDLTQIWVGGYSPTCLFSLNNSETVKAVILAFYSIQ